MRKIYNKLIRDNIPEIIASNGSTPKIHKLKKSEFISALKLKLREEVDELLEAKGANEIMNELTDISEVLDTILKLNNISKNKLYGEQKRKNAKRGAFGKRLFLEYVDEEEDIEIIDVIDKNDEVIKSVPTNEIYKNKLSHRIVHVLIFDEKDRLACQVRSKDKSFCPGCISTSVGGHVQSGELPEDAAKREMKEEIGKSGKLEFMFSEWFEGRGIKKLLYVFRSKVKPPFKLNPREVESMKHLSYDEIGKFKNTKIHPELKFIINFLKDAKS